MTDNGKGKELVKVWLTPEGSMEVWFNHEVNIVLISHALRVASLDYDNALIAKSQPESSPIQVPQTILDKMRRGMKL